MNRQNRICIRRKTVNTSSEMKNLKRAITNTITNYRYYKHYKYGKGFKGKMIMMKSRKYF